MEYQKLINASTIIESVLETDVNRPREDKEIMKYIEKLYNDLLCFCRIVNQK
ncbi:MAG: hypothetical protein BWY15_00644 [Firmicutes bacterium ADurb.Bin193]|nr:MAG: hypothetical protein BWY15_00644 [Firmicutes bacterium ADurb.Bin193]